MEALLVTISLLCGAALFLLVRHKRKKEGVIQARRDEFLGWLGDRIEEVARTDPGLGEEPEPVASRTIRELWGFPPRQEDVFEEIISGEQVVGGWDYAVHIHEGAEQYLGSAQFNSLKDRFASIPGVDECCQEDREVFLVRTRRLSADDIQRLFWKQFLSAAEVAMNQMVTGA
jgi:hypothetical protein